MIRETFTIEQLIVYLKHLKKRYGDLPVYVDRDIVYDKVYTEDVLRKNPKEDKWYSSDLPEEFILL